MSVGKRSIIVAGSGRSGTTWIALVLASCRGCISVHEPLKRSIVPAVPLPEAFPDVPGLYLRATSPNAAWQSFFADVFAGQDLQSLDAWRLCASSQMVRALSTN